MYKDRMWMRREARTIPERTLIALDILYDAGVLARTDLLIGLSKWGGRC